MRRSSRTLFGLALLTLMAAALAVKVKVVMHSEQDESKPDDEEPHTEGHERRRTEPSTLPFLKRHSHAAAPPPEDRIEHADDDDKSTTEKPHQMHPNELIFPLIYRQTHINSMFKFGENWYTWSTEKRTDGSKAINYYICYDEPKHCDDIGWERTDTLPKCAFQIDSLLPDDRACLNSFGVEPRAAGGCDGAEQMKVSEIVRACGPRIRSLWRFFRVGRRPTNAAKPADVNSLICEDEEECYITIEYRIHHDRITFSLHEPTRGQTFKSALKRDSVLDEREHEHEHEHETTTESRRMRKGKKSEEPAKKKFRPRTRAKLTEGKGVAKERDDSFRRPLKNKIKVHEDISEDASE